jgi:hypothetical protein
MSRLTDGTYGTDVEAAYTENITPVVVVTHHWSSIHGEQVHGTQALLVTIDRGRSGHERLLPSRPCERIWD